VFRSAHARTATTSRQQQQQRTRLQCQCSSAEEPSEGESISRRAALGGGLALATAAALQSSLPAGARVVSSEWEKVDLPVDPGVVLLDIGFTDDKHGEATWRIDRGLRNLRHFIFY
jgi:hypothetical protein